MGEEFRKTAKQGTPDDARSSDRPSSIEGAGMAGAYVPPPPRSEELRRTAAPEGKRTPDPAGRPLSATPALREDAPGWMVRARRMTLALEEAIQTGTVTVGMEACIERAYAVWELGGSGDKRIARVATLVGQAHTAIRATAAADLERAYGECAQVLWAGLPRSVKSKQDPAVVNTVVRELRKEADSWAAVVEGTAKILGWIDAARAHAAHAVRVAILSQP